MRCTGNCSIQQRAFHSHLNCFTRLIITLTGTNTDMCNTLVLHNGLDIGKVKVNDSRYINQVCDSLYSLL